MSMMIDGSFGEGGGQILRTSVALAILTKRTVQIDNIRAGRKKPGLLRQHLTGVRAAHEICGGELFQAELGARTIVLNPGAPKGGSYHFAVGSAGSVGLVLQTVLFPLLFADAPSEVVLEGGTHNPMSPPYDFLAKVFVPALASMGASVSIALEKPGFYPAGGGRYRVSIQPVRALTRFERTERGPVTSIRARAMVANLPTSIAERELAVVRDALALDADRCRVETLRAAGPGNAVIIEVTSANQTEVFSAFGSKGVPAEKVARTVAREARAYLERHVPVGEHLADQLLLPMALGAGGVFRTGPLSEHTTTNIDVIRRFLDVEISCTDVGEEVVEVRVER